MPRPTKLPEWASTQANVVEPVEGKKDEGFLPGEEPPAGWVNWLWNLGYQWVEYLRDERDAYRDRPIEPFDAAQVFAGAPTYNALSQKWSLAAGDTIRRRLALAPAESLRLLRAYAAVPVGATLDISLLEVDPVPETITSVNSESFPGAGAFGSFDLDLGLGTEYSLPADERYVMIELANTGAGTLDVYLARERVALTVV